MTADEIIKLLKKAGYEITAEQNTIKQSIKRQVK
jgi:hypothetical protein